MKLLLASILSLAIPAVVTSTVTCRDSNLGVIELRNNSKLPDPFRFVHGGRVQSKADWACRREEISSLVQRYELGKLPGKPSGFSASLDNGTLTISCTEGDNTITFSPKITCPSAGNPPYPAVIAYDGLSIPVPSSVAVIIFNNDDIAAQQDTTSRGLGKFYDLYGSNATASAMMAWAWGVSRIIDALEVLDNASIDTRKLAVTGCSRNGKGALVAGAFDERIALTLPQESGSGGDACWRLSDAEKAAGNVVQTASEIVTENVWFSLSFDQFANDTDLLPFDHHMLAGMVAPRAYLSFENTAYEWLSPWSSDGCMITAHKIWDALGVPDRMGFSQDGNHTHCAFPADQQPELTAYFEKFLLGQPSTNTSVMKSPETFNESQWIDWTVPKLF